MFLKTDISAVKIQIMSFSSHRSCYVLLSVYVARIRLFLSAVWNNTIFTNSMLVRLEFIKLTTVGRSDFYHRVSNKQTSIVFDAVLLFRLS